MNNAQFAAFQEELSQMSGPKVPLWGASFEERNEERCLASVMQNGWALRYVPIGLRTTNVCWAAIHREPRSLKFVPDDLKTPEMCAFAVERYPFTLMYVPEHLRSRELCLNAVAMDGTQIQQVPRALLDEALYVTAIHSPADLLEVLSLVPRPVRTASIWRAVAARATELSLHLDASADGYDGGGEPVIPRLPLLPNS